MVVEALVLAASWHPGHESEYNGFNPGLILSAGVPLERCQPYVCAGAYLDSYEHWASVVGGGIRFGRPEGFGIDLCVAHVHGSGVDKYPVVLVPSIYYTWERWSVQGMLVPGAVGVGFRYRFGEE